ncbi:MAG: NADH-quinone oxidoreductase subunit M [Planctomycetes bacterium]|nr:NADH-quinone oxidoreductase subunit M [Planctomycetota bacterium]
MLTLLIFSPLAGALLLLLPRRGEDLLLAKAALVSGFVTFALSLVALVLFFGAGGGAGSSAYVLNAHVPWVSDNGANIGYRVGVDGISIWLLLLTTFLTPLAIWSSFTSIRTRIREYYILLLLLEVGMLGVFCAKDLLLFYVSFEFTLVPLYFLIGIWGGPERRRAANKFFIYTLAGSVLTFAGVVYLAFTAYSATGSLTLEIDELVRLGQSGAIGSSAQWWLFLAFAAGFAIKVPLFPVHTWLPLAHTEAPTAASVMLAGVLLKLGTYGFCRLSIPILPEASFALAPVVAVLSIIGIMYAALAAWVQTDIKKLVAYSSVSHLGFCMLGLFSLKLAGVSGAVLYMVNHGLSTGALFLIVGFIYERYHTRDINAFGGLARKMPWMATFLVFFTLSSIGLPGLNGFVSEFLVLLGTATSAGTTDGIAAGPLGYGYVIPAAMGIILGAVYMLWMCRCVLFGPLKEPPNTPDTSTGLTQDLTRRELAILAPIALVCIWLGVYPKPLLNTIEPAIVQNILCATDRPVHAFEGNGRANQLVTTPVAPAGHVARAGMLATVPSNVKPAGTSADSRPVDPEPRASARAVFPISTEPRASARAMPQRSILLHKFHDYPSRRIQPARTRDRGPRSRPSVTSRGLKPAARRRITVARYTRQGSSDALDQRNVFPNTNEPLHSTEANADAR